METEGPVEPRTDTAVSPIIRGEPVDIPTPVWGVLVQEDTGDTQDYEAADPGEDGVLQPRPQRLLGWLSILMFVVTAVLHGVAVYAAGYQDPDVGVVLAWGAIVASAAAVILGTIAAITWRGRWLGVLGAVGGLLANPWVVLQVLKLFSA